MADFLPDSAQDSLSTSEDDDMGFVTMPNPPSRGKAVPTKQSNPPLATKADLANRSGLKAFFSSEVAVLKEDIRNLTGHMRATEEEVHDLRVKQDTSSSQIQELSSTCSQLNAKVGRLEDAMRQRNLKVRGIPDAINAAALPQYIRRLFSSTLTPKQAKGLSMEGIYCIPGDTRAATPATRDVILCFKSWSDKALQWRASLKGVTSKLRAVFVPYRWGHPKALIAEKDYHRFWLTSATEATSFL
ncbi:Hypothetical predicted protein [Pelobates cultripes]|uniref:Uncharacterized protein n=1 Tax=Pelobates cultripes TaxID=61616 RepID=A0AAD1VNA0_PELCU|nr:Hypothetical predicted protein [Pelobates cultripes]